MKYYFIVIKKELLEVIRDKNSFIMTLLLMLIVPVILVGYSIQQKDDFNIIVSETVKDMLSVGEQLSISYEQVSSKEIVNKIQSGEANIGIDYESGKYIIFYDKSIEIDEDALNKINQYLKMKAYVDGNVTSEVLYKAITSTLNSDNSTLTIILPFLLIFSIMTGAGTGIAINIFTGEKERGSLETLLLTQIRREILFFAKLSVVALVMLIGAIAYLIVMVLSVKIVNRTQAMFIEILNLEYSTQICIISVLIIFSLYAASFMSLIALKAKNMREAQLSSMLISFFACGLAMGFGADLVSINESITVFIPINNIVHLLKNLFNDVIEIPIMIETVISNVVYILLNIKIGTAIISNY